VYLYILLIIIKNNHPKTKAHLPLLWMNTKIIRLIYVDHTICHDDTIIFKKC